MDPNNPFPAIAGAGVVIFFVWAVVAVGGFILSAWLMSLYLRLVIRFSRKTLDREYRHMRGDYFTTSTSSQPQAGPRNW
jgi:hypothetical protein